MTEVSQCEPIIGWRAWRVIWACVGGALGLHSPVDVELRLRSLFRGTIWEPYKALEAERCGIRITEQREETYAGTTMLMELYQRVDPGDCPTTDCPCGIYASRSSSEVLDRPMVVFGEVSLWGKVIEHEFGYRAEYAYPLTLYKAIPPVELREIEQLRKVYGLHD